MYSCIGCNRSKGNKEPSAKQQIAGYRFIKIDDDVYVDHFGISGDKIISKTNIGEFSIDYLNLNRDSLTRLRGLRKRYYNNLQFTNSGVAGLLDFRIRFSASEASRARP